jgi:hypothetical protein
LAAVSLSSSAYGFCGFYVAKADTDLFNESSKVAMVRDGERTVITMANDYIGELSEFAMVIPVPTVITKDQVHISQTSLLDHLDAYTAPRLVEYYDSNPCARIDFKQQRSLATQGVAFDEVIVTASREKSLGVTIEESFSAGEYDILIFGQRKRRAGDMAHGERL